MSQDVQTAEGREESKHHFFYFLQIANCHMNRFLPAHIQ